MRELVGKNVKYFVKRVKNKWWKQKVFSDCFVSDLLSVIWIMQFYIHKRLPEHHSILISVNFNSISVVCSGGRSVKILLK